MFSNGSGMWSRVKLVETLNKNTNKMDLQTYLDNAVVASRQATYQKATN